MPPTTPPLRRVASCPDFIREYSTATVFENTEDQWPYIVGNFISLRIRSGLVPEQKDHTVKAEILKCFLPFTMSPVLLVRLHYPALDLKGEFILKLYDRHFSCDFRGQSRDPYWDPELEHKYQQYVLNDRDAASKLLKRMEGFESLWPGDEDFEDGEEWDAAQNELYYQNVIRRLYKQESEVYRRTRDMHGIDVPRCIATVELLEYNMSRCTSGTETSKFYDCPGILLQYIKGFPLSDLYEGDPGAPRETWQYICEDAIRIVNAMSAHNICNDDVNVRNSVVAWDPITERYKVRMIDFGHITFKMPGESDRDFREKRAHTDEEGAIGLIMESKLKEKRGGGFVYTPSEESKLLSDDFMGEHGPRI
ncbi:uncharacterized protein BDZ99DRAFT_497205 [Mytilinidion resinicola]|uniref:Protein kinase domain-containing protein n=1 Tax=Mytilinidion resinicola TaxID=574789 RepID=A0A6A6YR93_9PEZI|nr:uncharacterized protein BDZ99DRAFT_497205 [Mytilinidion resinicola]KAF2811442.1 hypothetical protein BDZ99DRAFT_497205 [Mytilinidion resinicola]